MSVEQVPARATVMIVYGDPVVSQTLAMLLQTASYEVRLASLSSLEEPRERASLLAGVRILLFTPGLEAGRRDDFLTSLKSDSALEKISILELGLPSGEARIAADYSAPWPGRTEDLIRRINAVLSAGGTHEHNGITHGTERKGNGQ